VIAEGNLPDRKFSAGGTQGADRCPVDRVPEFDGCRMLVAPCLLVALRRCLGSFVILGRSFFPGSYAAAESKRKIDGFANVARPFASQTAALGDADIR